MALVNRGFLHNTYMKKFLKNLFLRNCWSDFEIISQESGLSIIRHTIAKFSCNYYMQAAFTICEAARQAKFSVGYRRFGSITDTSSFWSLRSDKQMNIKQFREFLLKKYIYLYDLSKYMSFYGRLIFLLLYKVKSLKTLGLLPFNTFLPKTFKSQ